MWVAAMGGGGPIRNLIWNTHGALFNTRPAMTYALSRALNDLGLTAPLNVIDELARHPIEGCLAMLAQRFGLATDALRARFDVIYDALPADNQPPFDGAPEVCRWIVARGGRNIAITPRGLQPAQRLLATHELADCFSGLLSPAQGYPAPPEPAIVQAALRLHRLKPADTMLIAAHEEDARAGQAAGIRVCLFGQSALCQPHLSRAGDGLGAVAGLQLLQDVVHVPLGGAVADE